MESYKILDSKELFVYLIAVNEQVGDWGEVPAEQFPLIPNHVCYWRVTRQTGVMFKAISDDCVNRPEFAIHRGQMSMTRLLPPRSFIIDRFYRWRGISDYSASKRKFDLDSGSSRQHHDVYMGSYERFHRNQNDGVKLSDRSSKRSSESDIPKGTKRISRTRQARK